MTQQMPDPRLDVRGAVDLSSLGRPTAPPPGAPGGAPAAGGVVVDVTTEGFAALVEQSREVPVVALLWIATDEAIARFAAVLGGVVEAYAGRVLLARIDVQEHPTIAQAFQVQGVPTVVAVLGGQPVPLFQGAADEAQIREVIDQLLAAAEANGVTGRVAGAADDDDAAETAPEPELPPLHAAAYSAIEEGDLDAAIDAFAQALKEDPRDAQAAAGLANVRLLARAATLELAAVRDAAAQRPDDVAAQLSAADLDLVGGHVDDALGRLLELIPRVAGDEREQLRLRLLDYFAILGAEDTRVAPARRRLATALY